VFKGRDYLVMIDYFSRWIEVVSLSTTTAAACISKLKDFFERFGIPIELVSENGPQFTAVEFQTFADSYGFTHVTSSPYLPNANGAAERAVQTSKRILEQEDPWIGLMIYRDTVIAATGHSPSQLMMGRHIRTTLPTLPPAL
jgi:transposase InsO family protein